VRALGVVMLAPLLDDELSFLERVEDLPVEQFIAEASIEALDVSVLPGWSWLDIGRPGGDGLDPLADRFGNELRAGVGSDVGRRVALDEQVGERIDHIG